MVDVIVGNNHPHKGKLKRPIAPPIESVAPVPDKVEAPKPKKKAAPKTT